MKKSIIKEKINNKISVLLSFILTINLYGCSLKENSEIGSSLSSDVSSIETTDRLNNSGSISFLFDETHNKYNDNEGVKEVNTYVMYSNDEMNNKRMIYSFLEECDYINDIFIGRFIEEKYFIKENEYLTVITFYDEQNNVVSKTEEFTSNGQLIYSDSNNFNYYQPELSIG